MALTIEQLLATLGVDLAAVEVSPLGQYVLIQRDPQPDETNIAKETDVGMTLVDLDADPADPLLVAPDFTVTIDGATALTFIGGVATWFGSWTGTVTTHVVASPYAFWRVDAQQVGGPLWESEQVVPVDLTIGGGASFSYEFTVEDYAPPRFLAAEAISPFVMRVTFDDNMTIDGVTSVLLAALWANAITRHNVDPLPGVNLDVESVVVADVYDPTIPMKWTFADAAERLAFVPDASDIGSVALQESDSTLWLLVDTDAPAGWNHASWGHFPWSCPPTGGPAIVWAEVNIGAQFDLAMNWEMTPGCAYSIVANPLFEDESENPMNPLFITAHAVGFIPDVPVGRVFSHWRNMVPKKNRIEDATRDLERLSNCIEEILGWMLYYVDHFTDQWDPDLANDEQIEAMLYDMGNPFSTWTDLVLTANQKRKLLRILIEIYKAKGTAWGIEQTIFFLLGEVVHCVEYIAGGWVLGVDALGSDGIAQVISLGWETFDFTPVAPPWELAVKVDGSAPQIVAFVPADFVDPAAATAAEVASVIASQASGAGAYAAFPGQSAAVLGANVEPFALAPGDTLQLAVNGVPLTVVFPVDGIATPGAATTSEIAAIIDEAWDGELLAHDNGGALLVETTTRGDLATLETFADASAVILGLGPAVVYTGTDHGQVAAYSNKAGVDASIQVSGGSANVVLDFDTDEVGSTGGAVLAPDESFTLYSFDIETENVLTSAQESIIRKVAEYMKPAHTHLIRIRLALPLPWPDSWMLGISELDISTELAE